MFKSLADAKLYKKYLKSKNTKKKILLTNKNLRPRIPKRIKGKTISLSNSGLKLFMLKRKVKNNKERATGFSLKLGSLKKDDIIVGCVHHPLASKFFERYNIATQKTKIDNVAYLLVSGSDYNKTLSAISDLNNHINQHYEMKFLNSEFPHDFREQISPKEASDKDLNFYYITNAERERLLLNPVGAFAYAQAIAARIALIRP